MYKLNQYGKIIVSHSTNTQDIYYGCVVEANSKNGVLKLYVVDWRDRHINPKEFYEILAPMSKTVIKYKTDIEVEK